jgi:hypothetical protein
VESARKQGKLPAPRNPVDPATIQQGSEKQLAAYDKLNRLHITWAGVLRQELPHNDAVHLGILSPHPHHPRGAGGTGGTGGNGATGGHWPGWLLVGPASTGVRHPPHQAVNRCQTSGETGPRPTPPPPPE